MFGCKGHVVVIKRASQEWREAAEGWTFALPVAWLVICRMGRGFGASEQRTLAVRGGAWCWGGRYGAEPKGNEPMSERPPLPFKTKPTTTRTSSFSQTRSARLQMRPRPRSIEEKEKELNTDTDADTGPGHTLHAAGHKKSLR